MDYERILMSEEKLKETVSCLTGQVNTTYANTENVMALVILEGAKYFAADLLDKLSFPVEVEYLKASSYLGGTQSAGAVSIETPDNLPQKIQGKNILVIDDIYDTGRTLSKLLAWIENGHPQSIKTCVLLEKEIPHDEKIAIDFLGIKVPDAFVIGYGLDFNGQHRDLPFIAELASQCIKE